MPNSRYSKESNIEDISDDCIAQSVEENCFNNFEKLFSEMDKADIKNIGWQKRKNHGIKTAVTKFFLNDIMNLMFGNVVVHHSHVIG